MENTASRTNKLVQPTSLRAVADERRSAKTVMQTISDVLERVFVLPEELRSHLALGRHVSLLGLVGATGYPSVRTTVDVAVLHAGLRERRAILERWLRYSAEKEVTWGWFFEVDHRGFYVVGSKTGFSERMRCQIADPWFACASFIKEELESIVGCPQPNHFPQPPLRAAD
jgi:hypothetical protein